jgi:hypothetical protein
MSPFVCITDLIQHIVDETARFYQNTEFENTWRFYHDSLSLLTAKDTISWMKTKGYYDRWIHPQLDVNAEFTRYRDNPPGNSPEMMPMDVSLNKDIHESVSRHCSLSRALLKRMDIATDHRAFSLSTPKEGSRAYLRLYHPETGIAPTSKRIIQDIEGVYVAMVKICEAEGAFVPGLADRAGKRYIADTTGKKSGGARVRGDVHPLSVDILHTDLREMYDDANWCR